MWGYAIAVFIFAYVAIALYIHCPDLQRRLRRLIGVDRERFRRLYNTLIEKPLRISWTLFAVFGFPIVFLSLWYRRSQGWGRDILVEAYGMLMDIFVLSIVALWLNKMGEKRREIRRYLEEIDDFRNWDEKEAMHRIAGNVKRLNRAGVSKDIVLSNCYLEGALLPEVELCGSKFYHTNLSRSRLEKADFRESKFFRSNLSGANLIEANFEGAEFNGDDFTESHLERVNFSNTGWAYSVKFVKAEFIDADFRNSKLSHADFTGASLGGANFQGADLFAAKFCDADFTGFRDIPGESGKVLFTPATFRGANLQNADFTGVRLMKYGFLPDYKAMFEGAKYNRFTKWPDKLILEFDPEEVGAILINSPVSQ